MTLLKRALISALTLSSILLVVPAQAEAAEERLEENLDNLSNKLIALRGDVEQLNSEINLLKTEHKQEMSYLWSLKNDTQAELDRNKRLIEKLQISLEKKITENAEKGETSDALKPEFMAQMDSIQAYVESAIPFKKAERLADLLEIKTQVNQNLISTQRGFNKLWAYLEDEIRLTKETGLYQQTIQVEDAANKQLVEVVRLGMMNIYFETPEGQYGQLEKKGNDWVFVTEDNPAESKQIAALFDALSKQIRTGLFTLPMSTK